MHTKHMCIYGYARARALKYIYAYHANTKPHIDTHRYTHHTHIQTYLHTPKHINKSAWINSAEETEEKFWCKNLKKPNQEIMDWFGADVSMITDIFNDNIIHIARHEKYGYFQMNQNFDQGLFFFSFFFVWLYICVGELVCAMPQIFCVQFVTTHTHTHTPIKRKGDPPLTMCADMPGKGMLHWTDMFYFNICGSNNKNDIKLMAPTYVYIDGHIFVYFDNQTQKWQKLKNQEKWKFPNDKYIFATVFWVCMCFVCVYCIIMCRITFF